MAKKNAAQILSGDNVMVISTRAFLQLVKAAPAVANQLEIPQVKTVKRSSEGPDTRAMGEREILEWLREPQSKPVRRKLMRKLRRLRKEAGKMKRRSRKSNGSSKTNLQRLAAGREAYFRKMGYGPFAKKAKKA